MIFPPGKLTIAALGAGVVVFLVLLVAFANLDGRAKKAERRAEILHAQLSETQAKLNAANQIISIHRRGEEIAQENLAAAIKSRGRTKEIIREIQLAPQTSTCGPAVDLALRRLHDDWRSANQDSQAEDTGSAPKL